MAQANTFDHNTAWYQDGIIFTRLEGVLNLEGVIDIQEKVHQLIIANNISTAPLVCDLHAVDDLRSEANIGSLGKVIMAFNTFKHLSGIWIVGAGKSVRKTAETMNRFFLSDRMNFVDTVEEGVAAAKQSLSDDESIVDQIN